jgi:hypothetical protein
MSGRSGSVPDPEGTELVEEGLDWEVIREWGECALRKILSVFWSRCRHVRELNIKFPGDLADLS